MPKKHKQPRYIIRLMNDDLDLTGVKELLDELTWCDPNDDSPVKQPKNTITVLPETYIVIDKESADYVVGCVAIFYEQKIARGGGVVCHLEDLVVKHSHRGKGIGKMLVDFVIEQAKIRNCYKVVLDCTEDLVKYYTEFGFVDTDVHMRLDIS